MHVPTLLYLINGYVSGEHDVVLPDAIDHLTPADPVAVELAATISDELLGAMVEKVAAARTSRTVNLMLCILHGKAGKAAAEGRMHDAEKAFVWLLTVNPADPNARATLVTICDNDPRKIVDYLAPDVESLLPNVEGHRVALERGAKAAFALDDYDLIDRMATDEGLKRQPQLRVIQRRTQLLKTLRATIPGWTEQAVADADKPFRVLLAEAHKALFEYDVLRLVERAAALPDEEIGDVGAAIDAATMVCAIAFSEAWHQAFRGGQALLARFLRDEATIGRMRDAWNAADLPVDAIAAVLIRALAAAADDTAREALASAPEHQGLSRQLEVAPAGLATVYDFWKQALLSGRFAEVMRLGPTGLGNLEPGEARSNAVIAGHSVPKPPGTRVPVWFFLTWHEHLDRLLRLVSVLHGEQQTIVVSIGGGKEPNELGRLSTLLMLDRVHLLFRPTVTWGGPKLLYQNALEVFEAFDRMAPEGSWFNIICNRTYPLLSPDEMSRSLATPVFPEQYPSTIAPASWHTEWSEPVVDDLANVFDSAFRSVYETCRLDEFRKLAFEDGRLNAVAFNFSSKAEVFENKFKDDVHQYSISPYSADMRWMSFGRMLEFIDTSSENNHTYTRKLPLHVLKWIHSVLVKHNMRTGDPFSTLDKKYISTVLHNKECIELFSAMNMGFGPEMNFIDTVAMSPQYNLRYSLGHQYYRTPLYEAIESDIGPADNAASIDRKFFMRKTSPVISGPFIKYFSDKVSEDWDRKNTSLVLNATTDDGLPTAMMPGARDLLGDRLAGVTGRLRDLKGQVIADITFGLDGALSAGPDPLGRWNLTEEGLIADFAVHNWGRKVYQRVVSNADTLTLAAAEIASARNAWGVFIDLDLSVLWDAQPAPTWILEPYSLDSHECAWNISHSADASLLRAFGREALEDYPVPVVVAAAGPLEMRQAGDQFFALTQIDQSPVLLKYDGFAFADRAAKAIFERASVEDLALWDDATPTSINIGLQTESIVGRYTLELLDQSRIVTLGADGRILDIDGAPLGWWMTSKAGLQVFGVPGLRSGLAGQFQMVSGALRLSGWGWRDLQNAVTFVLRRS